MDNTATLQEYVETMQKLQKLVKEQETELIALKNAIRIFANSVDLSKK